MLQLVNGTPTASSANIRLADSAGRASMQLLQAFNAVGELIKKKKLPAAVCLLKPTFGNCLGAEGKESAGLEPLSKTLPVWSFQIQDEEPQKPPAASLQAGSRGLKWGVNKTVTVGCPKALSAYKCPWRTYFQSRFRRCADGVLKHPDTLY